LGKELIGTVIEEEKRQGLKKWN